MATMTATAVPAMSMLLPPQPAFNRCSRASTTLDLQLTERFWKAVKLDSPTSPTFDSYLQDSPIDEKLMRVTNVDDATTTFIDDPIVAFETLDCYSPNRPTFTPISTHDDPTYEPCPFGEPVDVHESPAPTLASIRYQEKSASRSASPWSSMTLRPTRFRKPSLSLNTKQGPSVLALASAFLDSIVRLARSRTSTPTTFNDGQGPVTILESEVLINVLEDGKRAGLHGSTSLLGIGKALAKLEIPPSSTLSSSSHLWDAASPMTSTEGPASCSEELDAMSHISWERQLDSAKARAWDGEPDRQRGRSF